VRRQLKVLQSTSLPSIEELSGAERPLRPDSTAWNKLSQEVSRQYTSGSMDTADAKLPSRLLRIDHDATIEGLISKRESGTIVSFRYQHVEQLLIQAAEMMERGLRLRETWNELSARSFMLASDLREFQELDRIHADEIKAGVYRLPYTQSSAELSAQQTLAEVSKAAKQILEELINERYTNSAMNEQSGFAQLIAWLSHIATFQYPNTGDALIQTWNGVAKTSAEHAKDSAQGSSWHSLTTQLNLLLSQMQALSSTQLSATERANGMRTKVAWDIADSDFQRRRTDVARRLNEFKALAATAKDGALNYPEQMKSLKVRFDEDLAEASARLKAAQNGMKLLYGYSVGLPTNADELSIRSPFDALLVWTRAALSWLDAFAQLDQNFAIPVSLKHHLGHEAWKNGKEKGKWELELSSSLFADQAHVRMRGISVYVETLLLHDYFTLRFFPPRSSYVNHLDGSRADLDQKDVPPIVVGRATHRNSPRDPDLVGIQALHNASPIGIWTVELLLPGLSRSKPCDLEDITFDLHLAMRFAPGATPGSD